ncbi:hypothetical protein MY5147_000584 [Beauveria neobassiana]
MAYIETETETTTLFIPVRPMDQGLHQLSATALQAKLTAGEITSVDLIKSYLRRIERYNSRLNCLLSIRPRTQLFAHATALDAERRARPEALRSKLHGIPIILKDVIVTGPELGMPTTVGSAVFASMTAKRNAPLVDLLQEAGMIILGKSNMTEFCGLKSNNIKSGWSTCGGQTKSPYRRRNLREEDQPITAGSSSGSAVAVAAGLAPLSIGTETSAALVYPASLCGIYAYKCGYKTVPLEGVFRVSESYDCVGSIARDPTDIVTLSEIMQRNPRYSISALPKDGHLGQEFRGLAVGVVASTWGVHESLVAEKWGDARVIKEYENAVSKMRGRGGRVVYPVQAPEPDSIKYGRDTLISTSYGEFSDQVKEFIGCFEHAGIEDLKDIIAWNHAHADTALPLPYDTQTELIAAANSKMRPEMLQDIVTRLRHLAGDNGISDIMRRNGDLDIVLSSSECQLVTYAACAGWPCATVPLGNWRKNGQPYGMFALSKNGDEKTLLRFVFKMETALRSWELDNNIKLIDTKRDALYQYDAEAQKAAQNARPWMADPNYFKHVRISAVALIKMTMHARSGGNLEIMGLMQGYTEGDTFVVTDAFRLPVEGTETRVNAQGEANEYIVEYLDLCRAQGRQENVVGWYHSHPGYGCWLSGIDVETEAMQQQFQDPFLAVVVDPDRTISAGKVDIGAFRTYPATYKADAAGADGFQAVPLDKAAEFGAHSGRYYSLEVSHFKSSLDTHLLELLWHKYWVQTLSQNPLLTNRDFANKQMLDLASRIKEATTAIRRGRGSQMLVMGGGGGGSKAGDKAMQKLSSEASMIAAKEKAGFLATGVKASLFNDLGDQNST